MKNYGIKAFHKIKTEDGTKPGIMEIEFRCKDKRGMRSKANSIRKDIQKKLKDLNGYFITASVGEINEAKSDEHIKFIRGSVYNMTGKGKIDKLSVMKNKQKELV